MGGTLVLVGTLSLILAVLTLTSASHHLHLKGKVREETSSLVPSINSAEEVQQHPRFPMKPIPVTDLRRHIRSVDQGIQQSNEPQFETDDGIQSNSDAGEDFDVAHKGPRSFLPSDVLRYLPPTSLTRENEYGLKNRWYFNGFGHFPRGGRADSHFIRFGRTANFDGPLANLMSNNMNPNKKNNFIRLGREKSRQNNFIRLGRSGWGSNERFGSKIGYFPDYYSNLSGSSPNVWSTGDLAPLPHDNTENSSPA